MNGLFNLTCKELVRFPPKAAFIHLSRACGSTFLDAGNVHCPISKNSIPVPSVLLFQGMWQCQTVESNLYVEGQEREVGFRNSATSRRRTFEVLELH